MQSLLQPRYELHKSVDKDLRTRIAGPHGERHESNVQQIGEGTASARDADFDLYMSSATF